MAFQTIVAGMIALLLGVLPADMAAAASVLREGGKTYIVDRLGERWDVTQAESIGFEPSGFEYGIGRDAFIPLDDSRVREGSGDAPDSLRVIGVAEGEQSRAYSVRMLTGHEIANSTLGGREIAVAY